MRIRIEAVRNESIEVIFYESHEFAGRVKMSRPTFKKFCQKFGVTAHVYKDWEAELL